MKDNVNTKLYSTDIDKDRIIMIAVETNKSLNKVDSLKELKLLIDTTGNVVVGQLTQNLSEVNKRHYVGKGKLEEIKSLIDLHNANCVVADDELSSNQIKILEETLELKVIDRTLVILDIFANRAVTHEGKVQVELAQLKYRLNHVVGSYEHLSGQGSGIGSKGPGETKLETDKRLIRDKIILLNKDLDEIEKHRNLQREQKKKNPTPVVSIVGYTNAGKSTLLNLLTNSNILSEDKLFATLDTTTRKFKLPSGSNILLVDTVGFIQNLPHQLIKSFNSTLNEARDADILIHLVDASSPIRQTYMETVYDTLKEIDSIDKPILTVFNKIDMDIKLPIPNDPKAVNTVCVSATTGNGIDDFTNILEDIVLSLKTEMTILLPYNKAHLTSYIYSNCDVITEKHTNNGYMFFLYGSNKDLSVLKDFMIK